MARNAHTGEKTTATKPERRHAAAVSAAERSGPTAAARQRTAATFAHLDKTKSRHERRAQSGR